MYILRETWSIYYMKKKQSIWSRLFTIGVVCAYLGLILILVLQALTPGNESGNISNNVGDQINSAITQIEKPKVERVDVANISIDELRIGDISLSTENATMKVGDTGMIITTVSPADASNKSLLFSSSNDSILKVYTDGRVQALQEGNAIITVISEDNPNIQKTIIINVAGIPLEGLKILLPNSEFEPNKIYGCDLTYLPTNTSERSVVWASSNPDVLTVDELGKITTLSEGSAVVTVTSTLYPNISDSVEITVAYPPEPEKIPVQEVSITALKVGSTSLPLTNPTMKIGAQGKLSSRVLPSDASNKSLIYTSSTPAVIQVYADGTVKALSKGEATITVISEENPSIQATITITVIEIPVTKLTISNQKSALYVGDSHALDVIYTPTDTTQKGAIWSSSDKSVLTVSKTGVVKGVKEGTAIVTVTSSENSTITDSYTVTVSIKPSDPEVLVTGISMKNKTEIGYVKSTHTLSATISPSNATNKGVIWSTSDSSVATVSQKGVVTFLKAGQVTITVKSAAAEYSDSVTITVKEVLSTTITLTNEGLTFEGENTYSITRFDSASLFATLDANATILKVDFTSSDPSIATIGQDGVIEALQRGSTTITVSTSYEGQTTSVSFILLVRGLLPDVERIELLHAHEFGYVGSSCTLTAVFYPITSTDGLAWSSSDTSIATISQSGKVTYHKAGTVTITAKCNSFEVEQSLIITIKEVLSESISLRINGLSKNEDGTYGLKEGKSAKIGAMLDANATILHVEFISSNPAIAKIGQDGSIEALEAGTVTITVSTSYDGETTSESFVLTINPLTFKDTIENFYYTIRKGIGHFGAFFVLGIFAVLSYYRLFPKSTKGKLLGFVICLVAGFAVAGITEILQLPIFTEGRYCSFDDVLLDFNGYCCSSLVMYFFIFVAHFISLLIQSKKGN